MNIINSPLRNPVGTTVVYFRERKTKEVWHEPKHTLSDKGKLQSRSRVLPHLGHFPPDSGSHLTLHAVIIAKDLLMNEQYKHFLPTGSGHHLTIVGLAGFKDTGSRTSRTLHKEPGAH